MKLIGKEKLYDFKMKHSDARSQIDAWETEVETGEWNTSHDIKHRYAHASFLPNNFVVFNIKGNRYRLLVHISYKNKIVLVKKAGTHQEYLKW